jgi:hypothetical protein
VNIISRLAKRIEIRTRRRAVRNAGVTDEQFSQIADAIAEHATAIAAEGHEDDDDQAFQTAMSGSLGGYGFDPATVVLLIQLALLIYQVLKEAGMLSAERRKLLNRQTVLELCK